MPTVQIERRRRGIFGWLVAILFWGWQAFMIASLIVGVNGANENTRASIHTAADQNAYAIGVGLGVTAIMILWVLGTVILGFMMMFTRGRKEIITVER